MFTKNDLRHLGLQSVQNHNVTPSPQRRTKTIFGDRLNERSVVIGIAATGFYVHERIVKPIYKSVLRCVASHKTKLATNQGGETLLAETRDT